MKKIKFIDRTVLKFILVGVINTGVGMAIMFGCYNLLHWSYWWSSAANYIIGSILSFFLNKYFTFQNTEHSWRQVLTFIFNILCCYFLAYGLAKPLVSQVFQNFDTSLRDNIAMLVGAVLFTALNYVGQRFWIFKKE
ncbi:GtrA family protein [Liquorilactobacillus ghanensis]|uniref:GtrA family protein n=1 Tax=Liquorilactobacillus ghanensis TaxID=399370 RepID=UPI00070BF337|nr:GtrA family protein [Liquorilactobacillus ghanensis]